MKKHADLLFQIVSGSTLVIALAALGALVYDIFRDGASRLSWSFITNIASRNADQAGVYHALMGSIWLLGLVAAFAIPIGVGAAVFLEEYSNRESRVQRFIEVNIQNLAAVPSIIYGLLGLAFFARGPLNLGFVVLTASMTLALLVLPIVIIAAREAIRAVPPSIREGSLALGATRWQTIRHQVLPAAIPGIATGVILAVSRAIGETAPLVPLGAATFVTFDPNGPFSGFTALPLQIFNWAKQPSDEFRVLAAAGIVVLIVLLVAMNTFAIFLRNRYEQRW